MYKSTDFMLHHYYFSIIPELLSYSESVPPQLPSQCKSSAHEPPQPVLVTKRLSVGQLVLRRGLIILIFTGLFVASIIIRITVPVPHADSSNTTPNLTTYPTAEMTTRTIPDLLVLF